MGLLVDDLLLLARLDAQRPLEHHRVDLLALATDAVHDAQSIAPQRTITMEVFDGPGTPEVLGDEAAAASGAGQPGRQRLAAHPGDRRVTVRVGTDADDAVLEVADEGPGMTEQDAQRVFERFYRTDSSRARASGGTGLGLSIVDSLVHAHGGRVTVTTAPGAGLLFPGHPAAHRRRARAGAGSGASSASAALILACASSSDSGDGLRSTLAKPKSLRLQAGKHVHVQMRHLQPGDDHPGPLGAERRAHRLADLLRHRHDLVERRAGSTSCHLSISARGTTSVWPCVIGSIVRNATTSSSS